MPDVQKVYVLLTDTGTMFTKIIKCFTSAPYNHASLALDLELNEVYSFGRKRAHNPLIAGFVKEDVYEGTFRHFPNTTCVLLQLKIPTRTYEDLLRMIEYYKWEYQLYRYNLLGVLGALFKLDVAPKKAYFCSQFVAETLRNLGLSLWERPSTLVAPHDFLLHPAFELIYEGKLYDYPLLDRRKLEENGVFHSTDNPILARKQAI